MKNRGMAILDELLKLRVISTDQHKKFIYMIFNIMCKIYCIKGKQKTSIQYMLGLKIIMLKAKCGSCGIIKTQFVKENKGEKFGIHKAMPPLLPKKGLTLPGHSYCGPGNPLDNGPPTNELDVICMEHALTFLKANATKVC